MVLIINPGSSSVKYSLFKDLDSGSSPEGQVNLEGYKVFSDIINIKNKKHFDNSINTIYEALVSKKLIKTKNDIKIIGFRLVHGGDKYFEPTLINKKFINDFKKLKDLAPFHNPKALECIQESLKIFPKAKQIGVFDTEFHEPISEYDELYAIPYNLSKKYGIRKYGFHGISYEYLLEKLNSKFKIQNLKFKIIICHLGSGCSVSAIKNGQCLNTSMGFTPVSGLISSKRCGDMDPSVVFFLERKGYSFQKIEEILNKESGLFGITGSSDMKEILEKSKKGNKLCKLAEDMFISSVRRYIGAFVAELGGLDVLVFSGGIGEGSFYLREKICDNFDFINLKLDKQKNSRNIEGLISANSSLVKIFMMKTNEEIQILKKISKARL